MTLLFILLAIVGLLVILLTVVRLDPFVALLISAIVAALLLGIPVDRVPALVERGVGEILGPLAVIIALGAMLGQVIVDTGGARRIAGAMVAAFGRERLMLALAATGFVVGIPLFYNVGFVILVPILLAITRDLGVSPVRSGIPMLAGLSIAHGFLPPHPAPTAMASLLGADFGRTLVLGLVVGVPTLLIAGPLFASRLPAIAGNPPATLTQAPDPPNQPSAALSFSCALLPVILIAAATLIAALVPLSPVAARVLGFAGNPIMVMLVALLVALAVLGRASGLGATALQSGMANALRSIAGLLLIVGASGALKAVLVESGAADQLSAMLAGLSLPPLVTGWLVATLIRIALGSATVAGLTAAGIVQPLMVATGADPALMVLAIGAGSLMCSHVNDSGFWMYKEYFGLTLAQTFRSWTVMESLVGIFGLIFVLLLDWVV